MSIEQKDIKIIDLNLFSGSADSFRTAMGGFFNVVDVEGTEDTTIEFTDLPTHEIFTGEGPLSEYLYYTYDPNDTLLPVSTDVITPNYSYTIRIYADDEFFTDDIFWKTYWMGGSYGGEEYPGIYNETVWDDYWFETALPYYQLEANALVDRDSVANILNVSCQYNHYIPEYQEYVANLDSVLTIPNMYLIEMFNNIDISSVTDPEGLLGETTEPVSRVFDPGVVNFVSLDGLYSTIDDDSNPVGSINTLVTDVATVWGEDLPDHTLHGYLSQSVPLTSLSASTMDYVKNAFQNIFFDQYSIGASTGGTTIQTFRNMENTKKLFPYYIDIGFSSRPVTPAEDPTSTFDVKLVTSLSDNNYSSKFLQTLKECFGEEIDTLIPQEQNYAFSMDYQTASADNTVDDQVEVTETTSFRSVDYLQLVAYGYENYDSITNNCYFVGERLIDREIAMEGSGSYRYSNSNNAMGVLEGAVEIMNDEALSLKSFEIADLLNGWTRTDGKYNEILAYRIEKIGGAPTGDTQTQNVLQNYWIFNSSDLGTSNINIYDSQIKYGENYTYNIYAYIASLGVRYQLSDLTLTRQTNYNADSTTPYCLEFYNPQTDLTADQLDAGASLDEDLPASLKTTPYPAIADLNVNYEPSIKIFEVPMGSKTLKMLDNPPNQLTINPFHLLDDSQTIGFEARYEAFVEQLYPKNISSEDITTQQEYLNAKNLIDDDTLSEVSVSQQRYLETYRVSKMPSSFEDFEGNLISTIDLKLKDSIYMLSNSFVYDMINTNQKYYYIFRVLNENLMPGQLSEIYEAELVNDGGYAYSTFEVLFEEDLQEEIFINPSVAFKKLIQLQPNIAQVTLNDENVDYNSPANEQVSNMSLGDADELIWDKTFKIRLTSKKTGRKMDLNVTYKYETESN